MSNGRRRNRVRILRDLLRTNIDRSQVACDLRLEIKGMESIFDMLIRSGNASDLDDAITLLGIMYPPSKGCAWSDLVDKVENYGIP